MYNNVRMQIQKTEHFGFGPVYSEDGVDYLFTELDMGVHAVVNQQALATLGANAIAGAGQPFFDDAPAQANGDTLGISLRNLRAMLLTPRQALTFSIAGDQVVTIPANGDARNGPIPQRDTRIVWIAGTQTAYIYFHIKAWIVEWVPASSTILNTLPHVVLSNRFRVTSTTDNDYYSRRHIAGQMIIDPSKLALFAGLPAGAGVLTPDNFRAVSFLQIPLGFKRENVEVTVSSDNTTLDYSYVDQETPLALGLRSLATHIDAYTTAGIESPLANLKGARAVAVAASAMAASAAASTGFAVVDWVRNALGFGHGNPNNMPDAGGMGANAAALAMGAGLPKVLGSGIARITGSRFADKGQLATLGVNILMDRFQGNTFNAYFSPNSIPRIGSIMVTQDVSARFVEVHLTFIPTYVSQLSAAFGFQGNLANSAISLQSMSYPVNTQGAAGTDPLLTGLITQANPPPPLSNGTRGDWIGALVVSLLATPGQPPVLPLDPAVNLDLAAFI